MPENTSSLSGEGANQLVVNEDNSRAIPLIYSVRSQKNGVARYFPMNIRLGDYDPNALIKTTPLGVRYLAHGLDDFGKNRIRKACVKMTNAGVADWIIDGFRLWATALPNDLPNWIDAAYLNRMTDWHACAGCKLPNGRVITTARLTAIQPSDLMIVFHDEPWPVSGRGNAVTCGAAYKDRIEVVDAYLGAYDGVENTWLRRCDQLIEWELGNWLGIQFDFSPQNINEEIGNKKPCP